MSSEIPRAIVSESNGEVSCSIEETNRIRALLGLGPLKASGGVHDEPRKDEGERGSDILRSRLEEAKKRRKTRAVFSTSSIADVEDDEGEMETEAWLSHLKQRTEEALLRRKAALASKTKEIQKRKRKVADVYDETSLAGMKVRHELDDETLTEGAVLTLVDRSIIDPAGEALAEDEDELENAEMLEEERNRRNEQRKSRDPTKVYDAVEELERQGPRPMLSHYDENEESTLGKGVRIGEGGILAGNRKGSEAVRKQEVVDKLRKASQLVETSLPSAAEEKLRMEPDYFTKKRTKKKSSKPEGSRSRKKLRRKDPNSILNEDESDEAKEEGELEDDEAIAQKAAAAKAHVEALRAAEKERRKAEFGVGDEEADEEFRRAQARARKLASLSHRSSGLRPIELAAHSLSEEKGEGMQMQLDRDGDGNTLRFDDLTEFAQKIGVKQDETEFKAKEEPLLEIAEDASNDDVFAGTAKPENIGFLEELGVEGQGEALWDPDSKGTGIATALSHFRRQGDLSASLEQAGRAKDQRLGIEQGPHPIRLQYTDEFGRELTTKEAFRQLCYGFHGKGPSQAKQQKRIKKYLEELRQKKANATNDTPLATLSALKEETKKANSPFVLISGPDALTQRAAAPKLEKGTQRTKMEDKAAVSEERPSNDVAGEEEAMLNRQPGQKVTLSFGGPSRQR